MTASMRRCEPHPDGAQNTPISHVRITGVFSRAVEIPRAARAEGFDYGVQVAIVPPARWLMIYSNVPVFHPELSYDSRCIPTAVLAKVLLSGRKLRFA